MRAEVRPAATADKEGHEANGQRQHSGNRAKRRPDLRGMRTASAPCMPISPRRRGRPTRRDARTYVLPELRVAVGFRLRAEPPSQRLIVRQPLLAGGTSCYVRAQPFHLFGAE